MTTLLLSLCHGTGEFYCLRPHKLQKPEKIPPNTIISACVVFLRRQSNGVVMRWFLCALQPEMSTRVPSVRVSDALLVLLWEGGGPAVRPVARAALLRSDVRPPAEARVRSPVSSAVPSRLVLGCSWISTGEWLCLDCRFKMRNNHCSVRHRSLSAVSTDGTRDVSLRQSATADATMWKQGVDLRPALRQGVGLRSSLVPNAVSPRCSIVVPRAESKSHSISVSKHRSAVICPDSFCLSEGKKPICCQVNVQRAKSTGSRRADAAPNPRCDRVPTQTGSATEYV